MRFAHPYCSAIFPTLSVAWPPSQQWSSPPQPPRTRPTFCSRASDHARALLPLLIMRTLRGPAFSRPVGEGARRFQEREQADEGDPGALRACAQRLTEGGHPRGQQAMLK
jgi:hypothetical protein